MSTTRDDVGRGVTSVNEEILSLYGNNTDCLVANRGGRFGCDLDAKIRGTQKGKLLKLRSTFLFVILASGISKYYLSINVKSVIPGRGAE